MLKLLADQLTDPQPEKRIDALHAVLMLCETQALETLMWLWNTEENPEVKQIVGWVGKQIHFAHKEGYNTTKAMRFAFRLDVKVSDQAAKEEEERRKLDQIRSQLATNATTGNPVLKGAVQGLINSSSLGLVGLGGAIYGAAQGYKKAINAYHEDMLNNLMLEQSLMGQAEVNQRPVTPPKPTDAPIQVWIKKLESPNVKVKTSAITQLRDFNNPSAIFPLGKIFIKDNEEAVKKAALNVGTQIYFSALYWQNPPQQ